MTVKPLALIVGVGDGLSASLARLLHQKDYHVVLAARNIEKLKALQAETAATCLACDSSLASDVERLFADMKKLPHAAAGAPLRVVIYNPGMRVAAPIDQVDPVLVKQALDVTAYGSFLVGQQAAKWMLQQQQQQQQQQQEEQAQASSSANGTILFTGASAGVKGFPRSAAFAMGKFAQRGLAESMARELHPQNIHVCWINIDGPIRNPGQIESSPDSMISPEAIAQQYWNLIQQDRSAWSPELTLRTWVEKW